MVYARCETGFFIVCSLSGSFFAKYRYAAKKKLTDKRTKTRKVIFINNTPLNIIATTNAAVNMPISHKRGFKADFLSTKIAFSIVFSLNFSAKIQKNPQKYTSKPPKIKKNAEKKRLNGH